MSSHRDAKPARRRLAGVLAALAIALMAPAAGAQNALVNGRFDGGYFPFAKGLGSGDPLSYAPGVDNGGGPGSGSLQLFVDSFGLATATAVACVAPVLVGHAYYAIADLRFAPGEQGIAQAQVKFRSYATPDCTGSATGSFSLAALPTSAGRGVWTRRTLGSIAASPAAIPPGAAIASVGVEIELERLAQTGNTTLNVDNVFLAPVGLPKCHGKVPTIGGTDAADTITGTSGADVIVAFGGDDTIHAGGGNDTVCGGAGNDTIYGGGGKDFLLGEQGDDDLYGGAGADKLKGGPGHDKLRGNAGNDRLWGGVGGDTIVGGGGVDFCNGGLHADTFSACEDIVD
jgi:Ca2+-binding RTX toxin-like protein